MSQRSGSLFAGHLPPSLPTETASAGPPAGYMSGPDRLPDSGIYLVGVEGLGGGYYPSQKGLTNTFLIVPAVCHLLRQAQETRRCPSHSVIISTVKRQTLTHTRKGKPQRNLIKSRATCKIKMRFSLTGPDVSVAWRFLQEVANMETGVCQLVEKLSCKYCDIP